VEGVVSPVAAVSAPILRGFPISRDGTDRFSPFVLPTELPS